MALEEVVVAAVEVEVVLLLLPCIIPQPATIIATAAIKKIFFIILYSFCLFVRL